MSHHSSQPDPVSEWVREINALIHPIDEEVRLRTAIFKDHVMPIFEADAERARTITAVSGGALVASISVFQLLAEKSLRAEWLLGVCWVLFALAIVANIATASQTGAVRAFTLNVYRKRDAILREIVAIPETQERMRRMYELYGAAMQEVDKEYTEAVTEYGNHARVSGVAFMLAFTALIGFGILNLY